MPVAPIDPATAVLMLVTLGTAVVSLLAWRRRPEPGSTTLAILLGATAVWTGAVVVASNVSGYWPSRIAVNVVLVSTAVSAVAFFAFSLEYTGRERYLQWPYPLLLALEPAAVAVLTFTNEYHGLFWSGVFQSGTHYSGYYHTAYLGHWLHIGITYLLSAASIGLLAHKLLRSRAVHRVQTAAVLVAGLAPVVGNVLYVTGVFELGQIVGFGVMGLALYWAIVKGRLGDLTPVARATVLEELEMGVLVVDDEGRITDTNPYAKSLLGVDESVVIGSSLSEVFADRRELVETYGDRSQVDDTITVDIDGQPRRMSLKLSTLTDSLGREVGRLILFEDVTERHRRREEIEQQNEQLQQFASMVSHDIRNPLDVASGYVELMRESRTPAEAGAVTLGTDHLDETADALGRIENIVDDVLTLAREGEAATNPETVSLRRSARQAWEHVVTDDARLLVGANAKLTADSDQLERLFENLFRNAVEHGREDGETVTVTVGLLDDGAGFYVADDGPGIPPEIRESVFDSGVTSEHGGTGFGLAIVEELAGAHGWSVDVVDADGGGARFEISGVDVTTPRIETE